MKAENNFDKKGQYIGFARILSLQPVRPKNINWGDLSEGGVDQVPYTSNL